MPYNLILVKKRALNGICRKKITDLMFFYIALHLIIGCFAKYKLLCSQTLLLRTIVVLKIE